MSSSRTTSQACASCKYQRKKCDPDCPLAPFFPQHRRDDFLNAHKIFGVRNMLSLTKDLGPEEKSDAMKTLIYQANARARDPVGGCCQIISELQQLISHHEVEYKLVLDQLAVCQAQQLATYNATSHFQTYEESQQSIIIPDTHHSSQEPFISSSFPEQQVQPVFADMCEEDIKPLLVFDENEKEAVAFDDAKARSGDG